MENFDPFLQKDFLLLEIDIFFQKDVEQSPPLGGYPIIHSSVARTFWASHTEIG